MDSEKHKMKIFISHSSKDKDKINILSKNLKLLGCDVFYSSDITTNKIRYGTSDGGIYEKIKTEIEKSDVVLFMVSKNFYDSLASMIEVGIAFTLQKEMIPVSFVSGEYREDLKAIFHHGQLLACLDNEDDVMRLLVQVSDNQNPVDIFQYQKEIVKSIKEINFLSKSTTETAIMISDENIDNTYIESRKIDFTIHGIDDEPKENEIINMVSKFKRLQEFDYIFIKYIVEAREYNFDFSENYQHWSYKFKKWIESEHLLLDEADNRFISYMNRLGFLNNCSNYAEINEYGLSSLEYIYDNHIKEIEDAINTYYYEIPF